MTAEDKKTHQNLPGVFQVKHLYLMMRAYCLAISPYPLNKITVPAIANAYLNTASSMGFNMSDDVPPQFSGKGVEMFGKYLEEDESRWPPAGSTAGFIVQFMRMKSAEDLNRLGESLDAMAKWMVSTGYLTYESSTGYLPTQRLLEEEYLVFKKNT